MKSLVRAILRRLPRSRWGDALFHLAYFLVAHRRLPRRNSGLFNDYLFYLKVSGGLEDVLRQFTSDKLLVKQWIEARLGSGFTPKTLAVLGKSEFSAEAIPENCVIKPTHLSGMIAFARPRPSDGDLNLLRQSLGQNLYRVSREANYKNLRPRLICEELIDEPSAIVDYKLFCFDGMPKVIQIDVGRHSKHVRTLYTTDWAIIDASYSKPKGTAVARPACLEDMLQLARTLAQDFESVRVDFYIVGNRPIIGELTHCPEQGHGRFGSIEEERRFSQLFFS